MLKSAFFLMICSYWILLWFCTVGLNIFYCQDGIYKSTVFTLSTFNTLIFLTWILCIKTRTNYNVLKFTLTCHFQLFNEKQKLNSFASTIITITFFPEFFSTINIQTGKSRGYSYTSDEPAYVHQIKALGDTTGIQELSRVCIVLRVKVSVVTLTYCIIPARSLEFHL